MADMNVSVILRAVDRLSAPLRRMAGGMRDTGQVAETAQQRLDAVGKTQATVEGFRRLKTQTAQTADQLEAAKKKTADLAREMRQAETPSAALTKRFEAARRETLRLKTAHQEMQQKTEMTRRSLAAAGVSTRDLARGQRELSREAAAANVEIERQQQRMQRLERIQLQTAVASEKLGKAMQMAGHMSLVGGAATRVGQQALGYVDDMLGSLREVERYRGELASVGVKDLDAVVAKGQEMQRTLAGVTAASFVAAAYDIKSGISSLSDSGVAAMTAAATVTAKATKAQVGQMTSLFATGYGVFKGQFAGMEDGAFGDMFGSTMAKAVAEFKSDGSKMQQAIESAGAGAANLGMKMQEEFAILGMLQQKMQGGESGTALAAFARSAAKAHGEFGKLADESDNPIAVRIVDDAGMLRKMPDILADLKSRYGDTLDAFEKAEIQTAFGTDEAIKLIDNLWGKEEALRGGIKAMDDAGAAGLSFAQKMAALVDDNFDSRMKLATQRFDDFKQGVGKSMVPVIERILPAFDKLLTKLGGWVERNPELTATLAAVVVGVAVVGIGLGALFAILSTVIGGFGMFRFAVQMATGRLAIMQAQQIATAGSTSRLGAAVGWLGKGLRGGGAMVLAFGRSVMMLAGAALPAVIGGVRALTVAIMSNPIGLIVGAIAIAAGLIYANWDSVGPWFARMWDNVKGIFSSAWGVLKGILSFTPIGMIVSHWQPLTEAFSGIFGAVKGIVGGAMDWVGSRLQSAVQWVMGFVDKISGVVGWVGKHLGMGGGDAPAEPPEVVAKSEAAQRRVRTAAAGAVAATMAATPAAATPQAVPAGQPITITNTFHIQGAPGQDTQKIAEEVAKIIARQKRGALHD